MVDSLDGVDNADAYVATDSGRYVLSPDHLPIDLPEGYGIEDTSGLHNTVSAVRKERDTFKTQLAKLQETAKKFEGLDPDQARETMERIRKGEFESKDAVDTVRREMEREFAERERALTTQLEGLKSNTLKSHIGGEFQAACAALGANAKLLAGAMSQIRGEWVDGEDGAPTMQVVVTDEAGGVRYSKHPNRRGQPMSVREFVESLRDDQDYAPAFPKAQGGAPNERAMGKGGRFDGLKGQALLAAARAAQPHRG